MGGIVSGLRKLASIIEGWEPPDAHAVADGTAIVGLAWPDVVGADVARRTRTGKLRDGVLTVFTAASTWSHQLSFLAPSIIAELRRRCPAAPVERLRFVVATGSTKAAIEGATRGAPRRLPAQRNGVAPDRDGSPLDTEPAGVEDMIERLRRRQAALDRRRRRDGWLQCARCGVWRDPQTGDGTTCAVCAYELERASDDRIERVLTQAPWLPRAEILSHVEGADAHSCDRVRKRLLSRWEEQIFAARRRLRRGELHAADRVLAWSSLMLRSGMQQHAIGRAVIADALGADWADALAQSTEREAPAQTIQKQKKTTARALRRRDRI